MIWPFFWAEAPAQLDPTISTLVSLLGTCGPVAGSIVVLYLCLDAMKRDQKEVREWIGGMMAQNREWATGVINQLRVDGERREATIRDVVNQQSELMREFSKSTNGICRYAGPLPVPSRRQG